MGAGAAGPPSSGGLTGLEHLPRLYPHGWRPVPSVNRGQLWSLPRASPMAWASPRMSWFRFRGECFKPCKWFGITSLYSFCHSESLGQPRLRGQQTDSASPWEQGQGTCGHLCSTLEKWVVCLYTLCVWQKGSVSPKSTKMTSENLIIPQVFRVVSSSRFYFNCKIIALLRHIVKLNISRACIC